MHADLIALVTVLSQLSVESIRADVARIIRRELLEYVPHKRRPRSYPGIANEFRKEVTLMLNWLRDNPSGARDKISLIKQLRSFGGLSPVSNYWNMGLKDVKDIIEGPVFESYIR